MSSLMEELRYKLATSPKCWALNRTAQSGKPIKVLGRRPELPSQLPPLTPVKSSAEDKDFRMHLGLGSCSTSVRWELLL